MKWAVDLDVKLPAGFTRDGELEPIDLSQTPQLALEQWGSARDSGGKTTIAWACVGTDVGTWNADVTELANQKLAEIASGTAARLHGGPTPMHLVRENVRDRTFSSDDEGIAAAARTFLVFTPERAHGCFVACSHNCGTTIDDAKIVGDLREPPPAGVSLRAISYAVHHPRVAAGVAGAAVLVAAAVAIATRPGKSRKTKAFPRLSRACYKARPCPRRSLRSLRGALPANDAGGVISMPPGPRAARVVALLFTFVLVPLAVARVARAQNAQGDAGAPMPSSTTRPSLVPDSSASSLTTTTAPPPTAMPAATTPTPQVKPGAKSTDDNKQTAARSTDDVPASPSEVFSEDWWGRTRPVLEIHGYFRTRAELLHNFTLGRHENPQGAAALFPQPLDNSYQDSGQGVHNVTLCGSGNPLTACKDQTQSGANMRFRINPELHISDNLRIMGQVDAFDNMVLGSTPDSYAVQPPICTPDPASPGGLKCTGTETGYRSAGYNTFAPIGIFTSTQGPPTTGINSLSNSVAFKRAWGEYMTPLGQLRFGRMPSHWGLGILSNAGDNIDSDYQTNVDRVMFVTGIKSLDLYFAGMWDFVNTGPTNASPYDVYGGQPVNTCNLCNVNEWGLVVAHRTNPELQKLKLARGDVVVNGGLFTILRSQYLDVPNGETPLTINQTNANKDFTNSLVRRDAWAVIPDLWLQILYKKFRLEAEGVAILGEIGAIPGGAFAAGRQTDVRMWGMAAQTEFRALEDKLHLQFDFGYASGDQWAQNPLGTPGLNPELNGNAISTFQFHPGYTIDLIFFRKILSRIEGAYYFRPEVDYDFIRNQNGQRFGGGAALIWSRASEFIQTPGHQPDLGVELDLQLYYQAKDGSLNDDPAKVGGFFTMLQYGVFFPLGGLGYLPQQTLAAPNIAGGWDLSAAQTVRWYVGVVY